VPHRRHRRNKKPKQKKSKREKHRSVPIYAAGEEDSSSSSSEDEGVGEDGQNHFIIKEIYIPEIPDPSKETVGEGKTIKSAGKSGSTRSVNPQKSKQYKNKKGSHHLGDTLKECHRKNFNELNFPSGIGEHIQGSKHVTQCEVDSMVHIMLEWEDRAQTLSTDERKHGYTMHEQGYSLRKEFAPDGSSTYVPMRGDKRVIGNDHVYEYIYSAHVLVGHKRVASTINKIKEKRIFNITENDVVNFIKTCPTCVGGNVRAPGVKGAKKPLESSCF
jgi:hypothetical protein